MSIISLPPAGSAVPINIVTAIIVVKYLFILLKMYLLLTHSILLKTGDNSKSVYDCKVCHV